MMKMPQLLKEFMFGMKWKNNKSFTQHHFGHKTGAGFTIIEIIVVIAVIATVFVAIIGFFIFDSRVAERGQMRLRAVALVEEALEAVRNFRDITDWESAGIATLNTGIDYHPVSSSAGWDIVSGDENVDNFVRKIIFEKVSRNGNDDIESVYNSLNDDPNTRKVTAVVGWSDRQGNASESITTYITNWKN